MFKIDGIKLATFGCGIKYKDRDDVLLVKFDQEAEVAGVFTQSSFKASPVIWCQKIIKKGKALGLIVNSGNANSFTSKAGDEALKKVVNKVADSFNCPKELIFMSSTGVIGEVLKYEKITNNIEALTSNLSEQKENWIKAAKAIMTTDLQPKYDSKIAKIGGTEVKINGFAKGSGMIAPNMATMLCYIFTDANINHKILQKILSEINERTFNAITVDSDQSTNDTLLIFASKAAKNAEIDDHNSPKLKDFKEKLEELMLTLAKKIVIDGEGATKIIKIKVSGAKSKKLAKKIAFDIANSPLVKTAIAGSDPNWGRIVMAIGKSEEKINEKNLNIKIGNHKIVENGAIAKSYVESEVHKYLKGVEIDIDVVVGKNENNHFTAYSCDLNEEYIKINKDYRS